MSFRFVPVLLRPSFLLLTTAKDPSEHERVFPFRCRPGAASPAVHLFRRQLVSFDRWGGVASFSATRFRFCWLRGGTCLVGFCPPSVYRRQRLLGSTEDGLPNADYSRSGSFSLALSLLPPLSSEKSFARTCSRFCVRILY